MSKVDFKLYVITSRILCAPKPLQTVVAEILDAGVKAIQLREKDLDEVALYQLAQPIAELCRSYHADLYVNSNVRVAVNVGATGVHLPDNDIVVNEVLSQSDTGLVIGSSTHSVETARQRETQGVDFITYSPIFPTKSKPNYGPAVGVDKLAALVKQVKIPVYALGGITPARVGECLEDGAAGIAMMSGIMSPIDAGKRARRYIQALDAADAE